MSIIKRIPGKTVYILRNTPRYVRIAITQSITFSSFFAILLLSMLELFLKIPTKIPYISAKLTPHLQFVSRIYQRILGVVYERLESFRPFKIKRRYLIYVSVENLKIRKSRSIITILGMSVGVGIIVLLLSMGYGVERLVISQIASLDELKVVDVSAGESSKSTLTNTAVLQMKALPKVKDVIPLISVVGRLNYKNAKTDILVHAVPREFFEKNRQDFVSGTYFKDTADFNITQVSNNPDVAGVSSFVVRASFGTRILPTSVLVRVLPGDDIPVYDTCSISDEVLGFTKRTSGSIRGFQLYGGEYAPFDKQGRVAFDDEQDEYLGSWIKAEFPVYPATEIETEDSGVRAVQEAQWMVGCVPMKYLQIAENYQIDDGPRVLGEATDSATLTTTDSSNAQTENSLIDTFFNLEVATDSALFSDLSAASGSGELETVFSNTKQSDTKKEQVLEFPKPVSGTAVASSGLLRLLGIDPAQFKNESINVSFIIIRSLLPDISGRVLTSEEKYTITGVMNDDENQFIYIPIQDMNILGISNYSQVKVLVDQEQDMLDIRHSIDSMGYKTASTSDTVDQVESFFAGLRGILGFLGFIALGVASLGMFNTLTVSLLERSREIGGMKTMGMVSGEIQELFLAEALIMGFGGGLGGLILGAVIGKMISYIISLFAFTQGVGFLELTYIPISLVLFIIGCSFVVGVITGLYPAYRAKKISALNALRYE